MEDKNAIEWITSILVIVGAINWGLVGAFQFDLVMTLLGGMPWLMNLVYILVGLSGLYMIYDIAK